MEVYPSKKQHILGVLVARMVTNQLPSCTSNATECLQWCAFNPVKRHLFKALHKFGPKWGRGGIVGLYPELYGTRKQTERQPFDNFIATHRNILQIPTCQFPVTDDTIQKYCIILTIHAHVQDGRLREELLSGN